MCVDDDSDDGLTELQVYEIDADELNNPPAVLNVIECGYMYVLPLMSEPTPFSGSNQAFALQNVEFVDQCIDELLGNSCIKELDAAPVICIPYSVVESNSEKKQLVINLRHLNRFLFKQKF